MTLATRHNSRHYPNTRIRSVCTSPTYFEARNILHSLYQHPVQESVHVEGGAYWCGISPAGRFILLEARDKISTGSTRRAQLWLKMVDIRAPPKEKHAKKERYEQ